MLRVRLAFASVLLAFVPALGCQPERPPASPSGDQSGFAEGYPTRLNEVRTAAAEDEARTRRDFDAIRALPSQVRDTDFGAVAELVRRSDATGRSSHYADQALDNEAAAGLFSEDKGALRRRIANAVSNSIKQKYGNTTKEEKEKEKEKEKAPECQCLVDQADELGGMAAAIAQRSVERQFERRLEAHSEAARYLEDERDVLGEQNLPTLEKQSDAITRASFVSHVRLELYRREIESLLEEKATVKATLDRTLQEDNATLAGGNLSKGHKAALEARVAAKQSAQAALDKEVSDSASALETMEQRNETLQKDYQAVLDAVLAELEAKAEAAPPRAAPATGSAATPAPVDRNADITGTAR